jgi:hypothetical protein
MVARVRQRVQEMHEQAMRGKLLALLSIAQLAHVAVVNSMLGRLQEARQASRPATVRRAR